MAQWKTITLLIFFSSLIASCDASPPSERQPQRTLAQGVIRGAETEDIETFKNIPYAAAPVGDLRWRPPQPPRRWTGVRDADAYGPSCPQAPYAGDSQPIETYTNEDCLTLNIWSPKEARTAPVMIWIHGGGFMNGGAATRSTDGAALAQQGVLVVTFNYRLGRLGFFAHPALSIQASDEPLGNYGLMDQIAALRWVKENIHEFGGDPDNVTIFGESAGGGSVAWLMTASAAEGLFHKAIIQSGGGRQAPIMIRGESLDDGPSMEKVGETFALEAGISGDGPDALRALRALPADRVIGGVNMTNNNDRTRAVNWMVDGKLVVEDVISAITAGRHAHIPVLIGANSNELGALPMIDAIARFTLSQFGDNAPALEKLYRTPDGRNEIQRLPSDAVFVEPARFMAHSLSPTQPVFHYSFDYVAENLRSELSGARHASDVPYVFNNPAAIAGTATETDREMARQMSAAWVRFAKTGAPSGAGWRWPTYDPEKRLTLLITNDGPVIIHDLDRERLDLIEDAYKNQH